jgi:anti-sigma B factor antagonist
MGIRRMEHIPPQPDAASPRPHPGWRSLSYAIDHVRAGADASVRVSGDLDFVAVPRLASVVDGLVRGGVEALWLDLREVEFIDSTGLAALVRLRLQGGSGGAPVTLVIAAGPVRRLLELGRMEHVFETVDQPPVHLDA